MAERTRIFYKWDKPDYIELELVKWTPHFLIVKYPANSLRAGENWPLGRKLVNSWLDQNVLKIQGPVPDWALIV